jgi:hypothetical protein
MKYKRMRFGTLDKNLKGNLNRFGNTLRTWVNIRLAMGLIKELEAF